MARETQSLHAEIAALRRELEAKQGAPRELDLLPVPYIALRASGLIWDANIAAARFFGRDLHDLVNMPLHQFAGAQDRIALSRHLRSCELATVSTGPVETELSSGQEIDTCQCG